MVQLTEEGTYTVTLPQGSIEVEVDRLGRAALRIWSDDDWSKEPKPEVIQSRGAKFLYAVVAK